MKNINVVLEQSYYFDSTSSSIQIDRFYLLPGGSCDYKKDECNTGQASGKLICQVLVIQAKCFVLRFLNIDVNRKKILLTLQNMLKNKIGKSNP